MVGSIMDGQATPAQIGGLLIALRMKGETVDEVVGRGARHAGSGWCARGRRRAPSWSTPAARAATARARSTCRRWRRSSWRARGVTVAKHGNRAQSSQSGSTDVIEALGLDPAPAPEAAARCLHEAKLAFLFAPAHHAATKHAVGPRKEVGVRTLFNLLGPLTNPCGARVSRQRHLQPRALRAAGAGARRAGLVARAWWCTAPARWTSSPRPARTFVAELSDGKVRGYEVKPADFGLDESDPAGLRGGTPADNARIALEVLGGGGPEAARSATLMTAAAALYVSGGPATCATRHGRRARGADRRRRARPCSRSCGGSRRARSPRHDPGRHPGQNARGSGGAPRATPAGRDRGGGGADAAGAQPGARAAAAGRDRVHRRVQAALALGRVDRGGRRSGRRWPAPMRRVGRARCRC